MNTRRKFSGGRSPHIARVAWSLRLLDCARVLEEHVRSAAQYEPHLTEDEVASLQYLLDAIDEVRANFPDIAALIPEDNHT